MSSLVIASLACSSLSFDSGDSGVKEVFSAEPDSDVFITDDFSDNSQGWGVFEDQDASLKIENGVFRILVTAPKYLIWSTAGEDLSDSIIDVDTQKTAGPDAAEYGVICRYTETSEGSHSFYYLVIAGDTYAAIIKVIDDEQIEISARDVKFDSINSGNAANHIHAECNGSDLVLSANGIEIFSVTDDTLTGGDVGLIATTYEEAGVDVNFDNFVVKKP
jgi:hypothetical protein